MHTSNTDEDTAKAPPMTHEADIGSGEKTPGQAETDKIIQEIPALPRGGQESARKIGKSEQDKAAHGQPQREQNAARQNSDPDVNGNEDPAI